MSTDFNYFVLKRINSGSTPLLTVDDQINPAGVRFLAKSEIVSSDYVAFLTIASPVPQKVEMVDFHILDGGRCVFSKKIYDILNNYSIKGLQLVPVVIRGKEGEEYKDYWVANIYQKMASFDKDKTEYGKISKLTGAWMDIEKVILDKDLLSQIPLEDRLVFVSKENSSFILFHKSVVDIIMSVNPEGINPISVEDWGDSLSFH